MADPPTITRTDDPLVALRASVEAHKQATQASVDAGAQLKVERTAPATTEATS